MGLRDALRALRKEAEGDYIILVADDGEMRRVPGDAGLRILRAWYAREEERTRTTRLSRSYLTSYQRGDGQREIPSSTGRFSG